MSKQISKQEFITAINSGKTRTELMNQFGLPIAKVKSFAKDLNLTIKRDNKPKFVLVDEPVITNQLTLESLNA